MRAHSAWARRATSRRSDSSSKRRLHSIAVSARLSASRAWRLSTTRAFRPPYVRFRLGEQRCAVIDCGLQLGAFAGAPVEDVERLFQRAEMFLARGDSLVGRLGLLARLAGLLEGATRLVGRVLARLHGFRVGQFGHTVPQRLQLVEPLLRAHEPLLRLGLLRLEPGQLVQRRLVLTRRASVMCRHENRKLLLDALADEARRAAVGKALDFAFDRRHERRAAGLHRRHVGHAAPCSTHSSAKCPVPPRSVCELRLGVGAARQPVRWAGRAARPSATTGTACAAAKCGPATSRSSSISGAPPA